MMKARVLAAIRGAFTADAASMGTHWIYNPVEMKQALTSLDAPEFKDPPTPRFYSSEDFPGHYQAGMLSPYGEQLMFVTEYLASSSSDEDVNGMSISKAMFEWATTFGGRPDHATTTFLDNMKKDDQSGQWPNCGADDDQAHLYMKIVPVACKYAGQPSSLFLNKVQEVVRVHQNNDVAVAFGIAAARVLESVLRLPNATTPFVQVLDACYDTLPDDLDMALGPEKSQIKEMVLESYQRGKMEALSGAHETLDDLLLQLSHEKMKDTPDNPFYDLAARSCAMPGAFTGPIYLFYKYANVPLDETILLKALRENIIASGDTCSRAVFIGAVLSALTATSSTTSTLQALMDQVESETMKRINNYATMIAEKYPTDDETCSA